MPPLRAPSEPDEKWRVPPAPVVEEVRSDGPDTHQLDVDVEAVVHAERSGRGCDHE